MTVLTATYRLQFRNGMTFDRAVTLIPYLKRIGISHLYASPIFTATSGSEHGYDVTNPNEIDPVIGGREGFDRMVKALKMHGLGLILDIVPNHMAASLENAWWRDVIEHGQTSAFSRHFDVDWSRRLTLPVLADPFEATLDRGEIGVKADPRTGRPAFAYRGSFYPLNPSTYHGRAAELLQISDRAAIADLHDRQPYRLMSWKDAPRELSYRRFFEITGLVGVRVEDSAVFCDTHRLILDLVHSGAVDGLRIDHVDGLADPKAYLQHLRSHAGPACYIIVEKILADGEDIPVDWPISGTTGYEFMAAIGHALVNGEKLGELRAAYELFSGQPVDIEAETRAAKLLMVESNFAGEFAALVKLALRVGGAEGGGPSVSENSTRLAIRELLISCPVYRLYGTTQGLPPQCQNLLDRVLDEIRTAPNAPEPRALEFVERIIRGNVEHAARADASLFRTRFQQLTGPLMAKSVEDTLFFRQHTALALNEVGGQPLSLAFSLDHFHAQMQSRLERQPDALSATATHDTKRGEDARARLYTITEAPQIWAQAVTRWHEINKHAVRELEDGPAPEPSVAWMLYQALAGAWPISLHEISPADLAVLGERFVGFVKKALREAKLRTHWADPNEAYEGAVIGYARELTSPNNRRFLQDFAQTLQPFARAGFVNSLTQTIVKLTSPGIPDIYQGSEGLDFSLVDPDNRRPPDFPTLQTGIDACHALAHPCDEREYAGLKQRVITLLLRCRRSAPGLFRAGEYVPLSARGDGAGKLIAYARIHGEQALVVVVPRLTFDVLRDAPSFEFGHALRHGAVPLPVTLAGRTFRDVLTGNALQVSESLEFCRCGADLPFLVLSTGVQDRERHKERMSAAPKPSC